MTGRTTIYALYEPGCDGRIRYVGKTCRPLQARLSGHLASARTEQDYKSKWIRSLTAPPVIRALVVVPNECASETERRVIAAFRAKGYRLVNLTDGGEGAPGFSRPPEVRARIAASLRGHKRSPETCARMGAARRGSVRPEEARAKMRAAKLGKPRPDLKGRKRTDEFRARMAAALTGRTLGPEHRANISAGLLRRHGQ